MFLQKASNTGHCQANFVRRYVTFAALKWRKIQCPNPPKTGFLKGTITGFLRKRFH